jgi:hypothetical protein
VGRAVRSRAVTAAGVPDRRHQPTHTEVSKPFMPSSSSVGRSGAMAVRWRLVTASALSVPARTCGRTVDAGENISCTWPPSRSATAGVLPLYGTWTHLMPAISAYSSPDRCGAVPMPEEANDSSPGLDLASAVSSATDDTLSEGCTTSTLGTSAIRVTGANSFAGSTACEFGNAALMVLAMVTANRV